MRAAPFASLLVLLVGCNTEGVLHRVPDLQLQVDTPTYGEFLGDAPAEVTGHVTPSVAMVSVEGQAVPVAADGTFTATVPVDDAYRIVDVEAVMGPQDQRVRVPVFRSHDPVQSWPGGVTLRLTPGGMDVVGRAIGSNIDATGWDQQLLAQLPSIDLGFGALTPTAITHDPTVLELNPAPQGVDTLLSLRNVTIHIDGTLDIGGNTFTLPMTVGYDRIGIGARGTPHVDDQGMMTLALSDANIDLGQPQITVAGINGGWLDAVLQGIGTIIEPLGETLLDTVLQQVGTIDLGGPYVFDTDLLGTAVEGRISDVFGDLGGLGLGLGVGFDEPAPVGPLPIPVPTTDDPNVQAQMGLHEGLLQIALVGGLLDQLNSFAIPSAIGALIGNEVHNLPGGSDAPEGVDWCLSLEPQPAQVVRLQSGLLPWAVIYLPDVVVDIGYRQGSQDQCTSWLKTSLALEVGLDVRAGHVLSLNIDVPEGAVLSYGAGPGWEESEVIHDLSSFLGGAFDLVAGQLQFDLSDLLGNMGTATNNSALGALGNLQPKLLDSEPTLDENGQPIESLFTVSLQLWPDPQP